MIDNHNFIFNKVKNPWNDLQGNSFQHLEEF